MCVYMVGHRVRQVRRGAAAARNVVRRSPLYTPLVLMFYISDKLIEFMPKPTVSGLGLAKKYAGLKAMAVNNQTSVRELKNRKGKCLEHLKRKL